MITFSADRVVVYDGHCYVCSGWVRFFERHPAAPPFALIPMQFPAGRLLLTQYGIDADDPTTFLVLDGGTVYTASEAAIHATAAAGGLWRLVRVARVVPRRWRDALYDLLARNRYRWFGRRSTCYLPGRSG